MAVTKLRGTTPKTVTNSNVTGPLEHVVAALRSAQRSTLKQMAVAGSIKNVLEIDELEGLERYQLVEPAEKVLEKANGALFVVPSVDVPAGGGGSGRLEASVDIGERLDEQCRRLD